VQLVAVAAQVVGAAVGGVVEPLQQMQARPQPRMEPISRPQTTARQPQAVEVVGSRRREMAER